MLYNDLKLSLTATNGETVWSIVHGTFKLKHLITQWDAIEHGRYKVPGRMEIGKKFEIQIFQTLNV